MPQLRLAPRAKFNRDIFNLVLLRSNLTKFVITVDQKTRNSHPELEQSALVDVFLLELEQTQTTWSKVIPMIEAKSRVDFKVAFDESFA